LRGRRRRVLDEPEGRDCESSALVLTGCLAHQEHCAGAVFLMSPKEEIARVWLWSRLGVLLIKNITRARPQHDVRPGRQRVFLMSSKEEIARVRPWSRLGVLLIKNLTRARPPLDVRHPNGTHRAGAKGTVSRAAARAARLSTLTNKFRGHPPGRHDQVPEWLPSCAHKQNSPQQADRIGFIY